MKNRSTFFSTTWFTALMVAASLTIVGSVRGQAIWYVDDDAADGDGTSWASAFRNLRDALESAQAGDEIRIAQGRYAPARSGGDRGAAFQLPHGVAIYGGYAGVNRPIPDLRSIQFYPTILSGDLDGNDGADFLNYQENSQHVVMVGPTDSSTVLDGVIITSGNANSGGVAEQSGGGMVINGGFPTLRRCTFGSNRAVFFGGGLYNGDGSPSLIDCTFIANEAASAAGGGMANVGNDSAAVLTRCRFIGNSALFGGGMEITAGASPALFSCVFIGNSASSGGAIDISGGSGPSFTGCTITQNAAGVFGGGIHLFTANTPLPFVRPDEDTRRDWSNADPPLQASIQLTNSIAWGNTDLGGSVLVAQITDDHRTIEAFDVAYSCVRSLATEPGNIGDDPRFMDADGSDDVPGTLDDDIRLRSSSPCIDMGDPEFSAEPDATDLLGYPRVLCGRVDIGAVESGIGDLDCDRDVDLVDFSGLQRCFTGEGGVRDDGCAIYDFDADDDVDLIDYSSFGEALNLSNSAQKRGEASRGDR